MTRATEAISSMTQEIAHTIDALMLGCKPES